jgi:hypothetical protein
MAAKTMRIPPLEEMHRPRNLTYEAVYNYALIVFGFDRDKVNSWWMKKNEKFDNLAPHEMVREGKGRKLMRILEKCGTEK